MPRVSGFFLLVHRTNPTRSRRLVSGVGPRGRARRPRRRKAGAVAVGGMGGMFRRRCGIMWGWCGIGVRNEKSPSRRGAGRAAWHWRWQGVVPWSDSYGTGRSEIDCSAKRVVVPMPNRTENVSFDVAAWERAGMPVGGIRIATEGIATSWLPLAVLAPAPRPDMPPCYCPSLDQTHRCWCWWRRWLRWRHCGRRHPGNRYG